MEPNIKRELREAKYSLRQDVLTIELSKVVVFVRFVYSQYQQQRIHAFVISTLAKDNLSSINILSSKNSLCTAFSSHELCLFRHDGSNYLEKILPADTVDVARYLKIQPICHTRNGVCRVRYNITRITDLSTLGPKSKNWDFAASLAGDEQDYFALMQDGIKFNSRDKYQTEASNRLLVYHDYAKPSATLESSTIMIVSTAGQPTFLKVSADDRLQDVPAHEASVPLIFASHAKVVGCHSLPALKIVVQVNEGFLLLRGDEADLRVPLPDDCFKTEMHLNYLFVLDYKLNLRVYAIAKSDGKITCSPLDDVFGAVKETIEGRVTSFSLNSKMLALSTLDGFLHLFTIFEASNLLLLDLIFRGNILNGSALIRHQAAYTPNMEPHKPLVNGSAIKNELDEPANLDKAPQKVDHQVTEPWKSISDPSWKLTFPSIFGFSMAISNLYHVVVDRVLFLIVQLSSGELLVYRTTSLEKDITKLKRVIIETPINLRLDIDRHFQGGSFAAWVIGELKARAMTMSPVAVSDRMIVLSAKNARTSVFVFGKGEVFVHAVKGVGEESVTALPDGSVLFKDVGGLVTLRRLFEPPNYCVENKFPFVSYSLPDERILRVIAVEKESLTALVLLCKRMATNEYRLLLFDVSAGMYTDELKFAAGERVSNVKKLSLENRNFEVEDALCTMYVQQSPESIYSKWRIVRFSSKASAETGKRTIKFDAREEYTDQETNELITTAFNIGETLFLAIENRLVQMKPAGGYKVVRTYYPNTSYIVDACVNNNSVLILNIKGTMIFMIWMKDQNKLVQKTEALLCPDFLYECRFLDSRQAKIVVTDSDRSVHLVKVYTEGLSDGKEDITLKIGKLQRIRLTGKVVSMDGLRSGQGLIMACSNGAIEMFQPKALKTSGEEVHRIYKMMISELPYPAGINPLSSCYYKASTDLQKMEKREYYKADIFNLFSSLSLPWQSKIATSLEQSREESANHILESLSEK